MDQAHAEALAGIWSPQYRRFTAGVFIAIVMAALETYSVTAIAPRMAADLHALNHYAWVFSANLLAQIVGTVLFGRLFDSRGPSITVILGSVLLCVGLVSAAAAPSMSWMVVSRVVQGLGMGALVNVVYAAISLVLPERLQARGFSVVAGAYVLPAAAGPIVTGLLTEWLTWRAVFLALIPFLIAASLLILPAVHRAAESQQSSGDAGSGPVAMSVLLAAGVGVATAGFGATRVIVGAAEVIVGLIAVWWALRRVMPSGIFTARPVQPATLAVRGLITAAFVGMETYIAYTLTVEYGLSVTKVGFAISLCAISWAGATWVQSRWDERDEGAGRARRLLLGSLVFLAAESVMLSVPWVHSPTRAFVVAVVSHTLAGLGIGVAEPITGTMALSGSEGESGSTASNMQLADLVTPALGIAIGGTLIASAPHDRSAGFTAAIAFQLFLAAFAALCAFRLWLAGRHVAMRPVNARS